MPTFTETARDAAFLLSDDENFYSRDKVTVDATSGALPSGTVLGRITASGTYVRHDPDAADGSETEAGILLLAMPAETGEAAIIARHAQVDPAHLTYADGADTAQIDATHAALAELGIIVR